MPTSLDRIFITIQFQISNRYSNKLRRTKSELRPRHRGNDVDVSSGRRPARLTYSGKEFVDNIGNPSVKAQAVDAVQRCVRHWIQ